MHSNVPSSIPNDFCKTTTVRHYKKWNKEKKRNKINKIHVKFPIRSSSKRFICFCLYEIEMNNKFCNLSWVRWNKFSLKFEIHSDAILGAVAQLFYSLHSSPKPIEFPFSEPIKRFSLAFQLSVWHFTNMYVESLRPKIFSASTHLFQSMFGL